MATSETPWVKRLEAERAHDWKEAHSSYAHESIGIAKMAIDREHTEQIEVRCACHGKGAEIVDHFKSFLLVRAECDGKLHAFPAHDLNMHHTKQANLRLVPEPTEGSSEERAWINYQAEAWMHKQHAGVSRLVVHTVPVTEEEAK